MSIIRVGLSETKKFAEGWEAIFGEKSTGKVKKAEANAEEAKPKKKRPTRKKK